MPTSVPGDLPTNVDETYADRNPGDQTHQQHHDAIHAALAALSGAGGVPTPAEVQAVADALASHAGATTGVHGLDAKADLTDGLLPESQVPTRLTEPELSTTYVPVPGTLADGQALVWDAATDTFVVSDGLRTTGWRIITSWDAAGVVTGEPLPANLEPTADTAGSIQINRTANRVTWHFRGCTWTAPANIPIPSGYRPGGLYVVAPLVNASGVQTVRPGANTIFGLGQAGLEAESIYATVLAYDVASTFPAEPYTGTPA